MLTELFSNSFFVLYYEYLVLCEHLLLSKNKLLQIKLNSYKNLATDKNQQPVTYIIRNEHIYYTKR